MFERFSAEARRVTVLAQEEARVLGHGHIGTEHLLLAILAQGGAVADALGSFGLTLERAREEVRARRPAIGGPSSGHIPFTPNAKKALELALRAALRLGDRGIGTAHLLLGMLDVEPCLGRQIVVDVTEDVDEVRAWLEDNRGLRADDIGDTGQAIATADLPTRFSIRAGGQRGLVRFGPDLMETCGFCGRDLWEARRSVAGRAAHICADCVAAAAEVIADAEAAGEPSPDPLPLPPRIFGPQPSDEEAVAAVTAALRDACGGGPRPVETIAAAIEDGDALAPLILQAGQRYPGTGLEVRAVRFLDEDHAQVRFAILLGQGHGLPYRGEVIRRDGRWVVSRRTIVELLRTAGVPLPPED